MTLSKRIGALFLSIVLLFLLCACGGSRPVTFKVIAELNQEEFRVAFRKDDPLCDIVTAAMRELAADGQLSRLSGQYLGADYTCMPALPEALRILEAEVVPGRKLRVGVQEGVAPLSSSRDDGTFYGLIPDLAELVAQKLGWTFEYMVINSDRTELKYVSLMTAWYFATALAKQYDSAIKVIEKKVLDRTTHNKAIQKAVESFRITEDQKTYLRTLKY